MIPYQIYLETRKDLEKMRDALHKTQQDKLKLIDSNYQLQLQLKDLGHELEINSHLGSDVGSLLNSPRGLKSPVSSPRSAEGDEN